MHYSLTRATIWNIVGYLYLIIASFISTPILVHNLGIHEFGQYVLIIGTLALVSSLDLGLPQAVVRALVREKNPAIRQTIWSTSSYLFILSGFISGIVAVIILPSHYLIFALALLTSLTSHYMTLPQSTGHFGYYNTRTFLVGTGNTILAAYLSWIGQGVPTILMATLITYILTLLILAYFSLKYFPKPWTYHPFSQVARTLITFGLKNQLGKVAGQLQAQYGKYVLAGSSLALSAYSIATGLIQKLAGGVTQLATALYPQVPTRPVRALYYRLQFSLILFSFMMIGAYSLMGYSFLVWWLTNPTLVTLIDSALRVLVWNFLFLILTPLASTILDGLGHPEITSIFAVTTVSLEIILALILFPSFGFLAPVYANLLALAATTPILLYVTHRHLLQ